MVYSPQRRHAIASMTMTTQALAVLQQLYTPNMLVLVSRLLVQAQIGAAPFVHPTRSLLALFLMLGLTNFSAVFLHCLDFWAGINGGKGVVLDFVGQSYPASLGRILLLDLAIFAIQSTSLVLSYITNHGKNIPSLPSFPHDDLLLPPEQGEILFESEESDLESGILTRRKGKVRSGLDADSNELWLDDDEDDFKVGQGTSAASRLLSSQSSSARRPEPPLVFSLSLPYILNLIFRLPAPPAAPRAFAGTTPAVTPTPSPPRRPLPLPVIIPSSTATLPAETAATTQGHEGGDEMSDDTDEEVGNSPRSGRRARGGAGIIPEMGRIPGSYWYGRGTNENG